MSSLHDTQVLITDRWANIPRDREQPGPRHPDAAARHEPIFDHPMPTDDFMDTRGIATDAGVHNAIVNARFAAELDHRARWIKDLQRALSSATWETKRLGGIIDMAGEVIVEADKTIQLREAALGEAVRQSENRRIDIEHYEATTDELRKALKAKRRRAKK